MIFVRGTAYYRSIAYKKAHWFWQLFMDSGGWTEFGYVLQVDPVELEKDQAKYLLPLVAAKKSQDGHVADKYEFHGLTVKQVSWSC